MIPPRQMGVSRLDRGREQHHHPAVPVDVRFPSEGRGVESIEVLVEQLPQPGDMKYLLEPLAPLAPNRTLIFYDLRGRGESGEVADSTALTLAADVGDLDRVRRFFHLGRVKLIGHQWGAAVAAIYAVEHPDLVERLVLLSPYPVHRQFLTDYTFVRGDSAFWAASFHFVATAKTADEAVAFCRAWWPTYFSPLPPDPAPPTTSSPPRSAMCPGGASSSSSELGAGSVSASRRLRGGRPSTGRGSRRWSSRDAAIRPFSSRRSDGPSTCPTHGS